MYIQGIPPINSKCLLRENINYKYISYLTSYLATYIRRDLCMYNMYIIYA